MKTHQITVRNVDPMLKDQIVRSARLHSQSINDWVLDAMRLKAANNQKAKPAKASWTRFIGSMGDDAFDQSVLDDFEKIEESMWK